MRGPIREAVGHSCSHVSPKLCLPSETLLTNIWEVLEDRALHGQLVQVCVQKGDNALRRHILDHFGGLPGLPVLNDRIAEESTVLEVGLGRLK